MTSKRAVKRGTRAFADAMAKDPNMGANPKWVKTHGKPKAKKK